MSNTLVRVPFRGDMIDAVRLADGTVMVSVKRICESLGVSPQMQFRKLKSCGWATVIIMMTVAEDGKQRELTMIPLKAVPMWLATINASKVKPEVRPKLLTYQLEVVEVLSAWFNGTSDIPGLANEFAKVKAKLAKTEAARVLAVAVATRYRKRNEALMHPFSGECEYMPLRDFCDLYGVGYLLGYRLTAVSVRAISRQLRGLSESKGFDVRKVGHPLFGCVNSYRIDILMAWLVTTDVFSSITIEEFKKLTEGRSPR